MFKVNDAVLPSSLAFAYLTSLGIDLIACDLHFS